MDAGLGPRRRSTASAATRPSFGRAPLRRAPGARLSRAATQGVVNSNRSLRHAPERGDRRGVEDVVAEGWIVERGRTPVEADIPRRVRDRARRPGGRARHSGSCGSRGGIFGRLDRSTRPGIGAFRSHRCGEAGPGESPWHRFAPPRRSCLCRTAMSRASREPIAAPTGHSPSLGASPPVRGFVLSQGQQDRRIYSTLPMTWTALMRRALSASTNRANSGAS
jgi:hypothetical protein